MGEAKRRKKLTKQIVEKHPYCIYCGGNKVATTVDHVPPIAVFDLKFRPKGLEFPACQACNSGARLDDLVAAMLSRIYPDARTDEEKKELRNLVKSVSNNCPGLLEDMWPSYRQQKIYRRDKDIIPSDAHILNCKGDILNRHINRFGAKIGYSLHFEITKKPVPPTGAACIWWITNYQAVKGKLPNDLIEMLGDPQTLKQGKLEVGEQFRYASRSTQEGTMSAHFATFRFSFAVCVFVAEDAEKVRPPEDIRHVKLYRPGFLKEGI